MEEQMQEYSEERNRGLFESTTHQEYQSMTIQQLEQARKTLYKSYQELQHDTQDDEKTKETRSKALLDLNGEMDCTANLILKENPNYFSPFKQF
jgi:hypothetical protein